MVCTILVIVFYNPTPRRATPIRPRPPLSDRKRSVFFEALSRRMAMEEIMKDNREPKNADEELFKRLLRLKEQGWDKRAFYYAGELQGLPEYEIDLLWYGLGSDEVKPLEEVLKEVQDGVSETA